MIENKQVNCCVPIIIFTVTTMHVYHRMRKMCGSINCSFNRLELNFIERGHNSCINTERQSKSMLLVTLASFRMEQWNLTFKVTLGTG